MDFNKLQKNATDRDLLGPRPVERPLPPPNKAHNQLMRKAEALVETVAKSSSAKPMTLETAYAKVLMDPANIELAKAAVFPAAMKKVPSADNDEGEDDGDSRSSYENDGSNRAQIARNAVTGRLSTDASKTGRSASATRTFSLGGRKEKIAGLVQKFLTMCPDASDDQALEFALSRKRVRKALEARLKAS